MEHARPPPDLVLEGGPASRADAWRKWIKQFNVFLKASGVYKEPKEVQASLLINLIGSEGYDIYLTFKYVKNEDQDDVDILIGKFNEYFGTKHNTTMSRFRFFTRNQEIGETIDAYVTALRLLSQRCEFEHLEDGLIRDRIVCGVTDSAVRDRLLRTDDLTLEKTIKICQANEISNEDSKQIETAKSASTSAVDALFGAHAPRRGGGTGGGLGRGGPSTRSDERVRRGNSEFDSRQSKYSANVKCCGACGISHSDDNRCPATFLKCFLCNNRGHIKRMCPRNNNNRQVHELNTKLGNDLFFVSTLKEHCNLTDSKWYETLILCKNGMTERFKLDSGSDLNVMSLCTLNRLGFTLNDLTPGNVRAQSFCGSYLPILGSIEMLWSYKSRNYLIKFVISSNYCQSILSKDTCENLKLIKRIYSLNIENYEDLFHGVGKLPGKYKIVLKDNVCPSVCPVRKIPIGIRDQLKSELVKMENMEIIRKVSHPTPWVNAIVLPAKKDGSVRVCLDPRPLNQAIRRAHYPLPTLTEIATKLHGAKYFSKLDARSGFWMVQLDDESADLCTFGTPFGRYQFLRLPYGISCASEVFHAKIRQILEDLDGVDSFIDDIIVHGCSKEEHDLRLKRLLDRAREVGIKFNRDKCEFCVEQVTYLGHTFSIKGMQIDASKVKAIKDMPSPNDRSSLERFLGMTNYLSKFISNYANIVSPLRQLLKRDIDWCWEHAHEDIVSRLKDKLSNAPVLALYSASEPVLLTVDASARALGAALMQAGRPVEYASLTLTDTQTRYAQIEKEMLAIVFALERFHQYVYGRSNVIVETDHKPLEALFKKPLDSVPMRLQRMMLRIQCYDFVVIYKPGKYMFVADTLSRAALPELMHDKVSLEVDEQSCFLINHVRFSDSKINLIRNITNKDKESNILINYILNGWPRYRSDTDVLVRCHWSYRGSFEYVDGVLFKDNLVFIPYALRKDMLDRVHEGHLGIDRCKRRARDVMFWNGMSRDVERVVRSCAVCAAHAVNPVREPMIPHDVPELPWRKDKLLNKLEENEPELATSPEEECVICVNAKATMQTSPCGHRVVCRRCFVKTIQMAVSQRLLPLRCVICRAKILRLRQAPRLVTSKSWQVSSGSGKSWGVPGSVSSYSVGARSVPASASLYSVTSGESSLSGVSSVSSNSGNVSNTGCSTKLCGGAKCGGACLGAVPRVPAASAPPRPRQPASNTLRRSQHHSMKARLQDYQMHSYTGGPAGEPSGRLPPIREFQREFREGRRESAAAASASTRIRCAQKIVTQLETSPQKNKQHFFRPLKPTNKDDPPKSRDHSKETDKKKDNPKAKPKKEEKKKKDTDENTKQGDKNKKDESNDNKKNESSERKKEEKLRLKAEKEAKKEAKLQAKEEERQARLLAKEEERQAKLLAKEEKKKAKKEAKLAAQVEKEKVK